MNRSIDLDGAVVLGDIETLEVSPGFFFMMCRFLRRLSITLF